MDISPEEHSKEKIVVPSPSGLFIRQPSPAEISRAMHLFRNSRLPPEARILVAVKTHPIERFVAATAWWLLGQTLCFRLAIPGGTAIRTEASKLLIDKMSEHGRDLQLNTTQYADLLPDDNEWLQILKENGFTQLRSERFFEVPLELAWARAMEFFEKYKTRIPSNLRTEPIRHHPPETILELIAPYRLMPPPELRNYWRPDSAFGFDLNLSSILFHGERPLGILLVRKVRDALCVDVRVVQTEHQLLRAMGNVLLFYHMAAQREANRDLSRLEFRGGEIEHRETANLAFRMGGHELPPRHVFSKIL